MISSDNIRYVNSAYIRKKPVLSEAWVRRALFGLVCCGFLGACAAPLPDDFEGTCVADADCSEASACLFDLNLKRSFCAASCLVDSDCPVTEECRFGYRSMEGQRSELGMCAQRVRVCLEYELCNGLDDDCDGVIDGPDCSPISACLDDAICGAFVCSATENFPFAVCVPPIDAVKEDYESCTDGSQCRNGLCETGMCSPLCRRNFIGLADTCKSGYTCAQAGAARNVAPHNMCQLDCRVDKDCPDGQSCVWRAVHEGGDAHALVCSVPAPGRLPLGAACARSATTGDDDCESGLCYGLVCTRSCAGTGASCADVGATFACRSTQLYYGTEEFMVDVCVEP